MNIFNIQIPSVIFNAQSLNLDEFETKRTSNRNNLYLAMCF